ncbi:hypothetical protein [Streptomyces sp. NPDC005494]|uniref:hypothetical protein n=1 Tax=Streptomyces sp. NPDC005494 TaxID=3364715 RepID=UPI003692E028
MFGMVDMVPTVPGGYDRHPARAHGTGDLPGASARSAANAQDFLASVAEAKADEIEYRPLFDHIDEVGQA